jgi:hypothetical protein
MTWWLDRRSWNPVTLLVVLFWSHASVAASQPTRRFENPQERGYNVDVCLRWGAECGKPAADAFCRRNGFRDAEVWEIADNIGATRPTITLADQRVCNQPQCDGFKSITCRAPLQRSDDVKPPSQARPLPPEHAPSVALVPRPLVPDPVPSVALVQYLPARGYDPEYLCWAIDTHGSANSAKGQRVRTCGGSGGGDGLLDIAGGLGSAFIDGMGGLIELGSPVVDWAASTYNSAKATAVGAVVDALKNTTGCGGACQWAVGAAVDAGMMAMGMPPSLPNFDQLVKQLENQGIDALADAAVAAAASQGVTIPKEVAKAAIVKLKNAAAAATLSGPGGASVRYRPDPALAYRPAAMLFEAKSFEVNRTTPALTLRVTSRTTNINLEFGPATVNVQTGFEPAEVFVPALQPRTSIRFVVPLTPRVDPHRWLAIREEALELYKKAHIDKCKAPASFTPEAMPGYEAYKKCKEAQSAEAAKLMQAYAKLFTASNTTRDEWRVAYTSPEMVFDATLQSKVPIRATVLRCPPKSSTCTAEFTEPSWQGHRADFCLFFGKSCGEPAAKMFCALMGYSRLVQGIQAPNLGSTMTLGDRKSCDQPTCAGFQRIVCGQQ